MTDAQILALARVFDQEWLEYAAANANKPERQNGAAYMWARLHAAIAQEVKNMHGKRGELLFKNYAPPKPDMATVVPDLVTVKCPRCDKVTETTRDHLPIQCGDCLMDRCEVVQMEVLP